MSGTPRDRDDAGRPRSARPRDAQGRPLPRGAAGVEPVRDAVRTVPEALAEAQSLLDDGRPFGAHEVLEGLWKQAADPGERALWRGMAQLMVGLTHAGRGNAVGADRLLTRGAATLATTTGVPHGLDVAAWRSWATATRSALAADHPPPDPPRLAP